MPNDIKGFFFSIFSQAYGDFLLNIFAEVRKKKPERGFLCGDSRDICVKFLATMFYEADDAPHWRLLCDGNQTARCLHWADPLTEQLDSTVRYHFFKKKKRRRFPFGNEHAGMPTLCVPERKRAVSHIHEKTGDFIKSPEGAFKGKKKNSRVVIFIICVIARQQQQLAAARPAYCVYSVCVCDERLLKGSSPSSPFFLRE